MNRTSLNKIFLLSIVLLFALFIFVVLSFSGDSNVLAEGGDQDKNIAIQNIIAPSLPKHVDFSGEATPLTIFYVHESLDRELLVNTYWHSSTILLLKRANRWFPVIEPILEANGIPEDFKYLALIESGFTRVVSPKGAAGYWQFLEKTAREFGLEVNDYVDERYNVEKSTIAACQYILDSYDTYKNWTLVAAAYNAGKRRISESLEAQNTSDYYTLYLNEETSRYVYRILAIKTIYENPEKYGFLLNKEDLYQPLDVQAVTVRESIPDLVAFAEEHAMEYRLLKELNPWMRSDRLPNASGKTYEVKVAK
jgi:hypothetical protein